MQDLNVWHLGPPTACVQTQLCHLQLVHPVSYLTPLGLSFLIHRKGLLTARVTGRWGVTSVNTGETLGQVPGTG